MKTYIKFIGSGHLSGVYADGGLSIGNLYPLQQVSDSGKFVQVINDYGETEWYCVEIFE